jgi:aconitate hydratase
VKTNWLASPPLVVAYALAGSVRLDISQEALGLGKDGQPVYLRDIWPSQAEIAEAILKVDTAMYHKEYAEVFACDAQSQAIEVPQAATYAWQADSPDILHPPFFVGIDDAPPHIGDIHNARILALLGDSVTTDHISPAGNIKADSPAGRYLREQGVTPADFNSYGSRRGNHEVMMRGTFANIRIRNEMLDGEEGGNTLHLPSGEKLAIFEAAMRYQDAGTPLLVIAGKEYGTGSSRDWAAKGTNLLGVKAVIAESFERIHRSNLVGMGVLPLCYKAGETAASLGLGGTETFDIAVDDHVKPRQDITVTATKPDGTKKTFVTVCRIDTPVEVDYYRNGGILQTVLRRMAKS